MSNEMSKKIHELRKQHKLTLEQVASVVGVGKSTVRKWETGMIANMKRDKIALLAQALHTTPEYLMGWEKEPEPTSEPTLTEAEQSLLDLFRCVPAEQQEIVLAMIRAAIKNPSR